MWEIIPGYNDAKGFSWNGQVEERRGTHADENTQSTPDVCVQITLLALAMADSALTLTNDSMLVFV